MRCFVNFEEKKGLTYCGRRAAGVDTAHSSEHVTCVKCMEAMAAVLRERLTWEGK